MKKVVYLLILCFTILVGCETIDLIPNTKYAFSVSEKEKIVFAPGNLQYVVSEDKWQFAEDQLSYIGKRNFIVDNFMVNFNLFNKIIQKRLKTSKNAVKII